MEGQDADGGAGGAQRAGLLLDLPIGDQLLLVGVEIAHGGGARRGGPDFGGLDFDLFRVLRQLVALPEQEGAEAERGQDHAAASRESQLFARQLDRRQGEGVTIVEGDGQVGGRGRIFRRGLGGALQPHEGRPGGRVIAFTPPGRGDQGLAAPQLGLVAELQPDDAPGLATRLGQGLGADQGASRRGASGQ
ncbi:hypothetical protein D3C72_1042810 [compost metagenome]